jgi:hypothetical protein
MPGTLILYENWKDYDCRKAIENCDCSTFCCEHIWEVNYLVCKIRKHHPFPEAAIRDAITACSRIFSVPQPRATFVEKVLQKLAIAF